jgi:hypothetical protein
VAFKAARIDLPLELDIDADACSMNVMNGLRQAAGKESRMTAKYDRPGPQMRDVDHGALGMWQDCGS